MMEKVTQLSLIRPALPCRYEVLMEGISPLLIAGGTFPFNAVESFTKKSGNSVLYFPESYDVDDVELDITETDGAEAYSFFATWRNAMFSGVSGQEDYYNFPDDYKKSFRVYRLSAELSRTDGWQYSGAWPKSISPFGADSTANTDALKFTVTFSVDSVERL